MLKTISVVTFLALTGSTAALSQSAIPDLRGTWKGESEHHSRRRQSTSRGSFNSPRPDLTAFHSR